MYINKNPAHLHICTPGDFASGVHSCPPIERVYHHVCFIATLTHQIPNTTLDRRKTEKMLTILSRFTPLDI
ncbi:uncharacterized protein STEHIDRAFT_148374 [Stereum hirsutum FP-91666 SS1]|uniref:uncharacterized protein n=1 Tax=Stereum hirsutum (strain FP-91666) TaxID=721885 RepID=UPI000444A89C|nr:uncharacterized protein STEHIDRAFT_148374 [Stereum hirsutum FP-91666 SS1]EIM84237.1 hypothetical protein STEHIDRAFT_148374 [Stereum hirsutum FP-91666 SS1]